MRTPRAKDDPQTRAFLDEIVAVYRRHGLSLGHEDWYDDDLIVEPYEERNVEWLMEARRQERRH